MEEYIYEHKPSGADHMGKPVELPTLVQREEIVRCRDCKHFCEDRHDTSIGWVSVFVCNSEQWSTASLMPSHKVKPDGFCAWAERNEGGDE